jgi:hypothetical protein
VPFVDGLHAFYSNNFITKMNTKFSLKVWDITPLYGDAGDKYTISFEAIINSTVRFCWQGYRCGKCTVFRGRSG